MKNFIETLKKRMKAWHDERAELIQREQCAELEAEAREKVQVMEFNGELFVSVNGVPLFNQKDITGDFTKVVADVRENYKKWKKDLITRGSTLF